MDAVHHLVEALDDALEVLLLLALQRPRPRTEDEPPLVGEERRRPTLLAAILSLLPLLAVVGIVWYLLWHPWADGQAHPIETAFTAIAGLLDLLDRFADPQSYEIVGVITSELAFEGQARVAARGVPTRAHAIHEFYRRCDANLYRDFATRAAFDRETVGLLARHSPDIVLLDGYLYLATRELLDAFPGRLLNLHFSDLTLRRPDGRPRYPGLRAVDDAIRDGQASTRATVHLVDADPDGGPPLVASWPFPVAPLAADALRLGAKEMFRAYVFAHQEWMIRAASGGSISS